MDVFEEEAGSAGRRAEAARPEHVEDQQRAERILWEVLGTVEAQVVQQYGKNVPVLLSDEKLEQAGKAAVLASEAGRGRAGASVALRATQALLAEAHGEDPVKTLVVQGMILEGLLKALYRVAAKTSARAGARELAAAGAMVSFRVGAEVPRQLALRVGEGEAVFAVFAAASRGVLRRLPSLFDALEAEMDGPAASLVSDLGRDFGSELLPHTSALRMDARKVARHLATGA